MTFRMLTTLIVLLGFSLFGQEQETAVFKTGVSDVRVVVQVTENNKLVNGLTQDDFIVSDEDHPQKIVYFAREAEPLTLLLLLDISGSMRTHIEQMSETARDALNFLTPGDRVGIMTFGLRTNLHFNFFDNHAEIARQLKTVAEDQEKTGYGTAINPAIIEAAKLLDKDGSPGRRAILIVTDNLGINYQSNDELAVGYLLRADASLNAIVVGRAIRPGPPKSGDNPDYTPADVFKLAEVSGGEAVKAERAAASFGEMISRIRDRYTIAYHMPEGAAAGSFHRITVALTPAAKKLHPAAELRYRSGYYAKP
jgi:VWFA-related protein